MKKDFKTHVRLVANRCSNNSPQRASIESVNLRFEVAGIVAFGGCMQSIKHSSIFSIMSVYCALHFSSVVKLAFIIT